MHEMSIALGIIDIVNSSAKKSNAVTVNEVEIEIGTLSGIEIDALTFALETACTGTWLENTKRTIKVIEAKAYCENCGNSFRVENLFSQCPECKGFGFRIEQGEELRVKSISID